MVGTVSENPKHLKYCRRCKTWKERRTFKGGVGSCSPCRQEMSRAKTTALHKEAREKVRMKEAKIKDDWSEVLLSVRRLVTRIAATKARAPQWYAEAKPLADEIKQHINIKVEGLIPNKERHEHWRYVVPTQLRLKAFELSRRCPVDSPFTRLE